MLVPNRPSKMPEMKTSKRKEGANAFAALLTYSPQKEAAPKHNNTCKVWRLDPKRVFCWTRLHWFEYLQELEECCTTYAVQLSPEQIKDAEEEIVCLA